MELTALFLISSIATARLLDKKRMRAASVAYTVLFIITMFVLLFIVDSAAIRGLMLRIFGAKTYWNVRMTFLDAIRVPSYGIFISGALILTFVVQLVVTLVCTASAIVYYCFHNVSLFHTAKKSLFTTVHTAYENYLTQKINLLYCRMLS